MESFFKISLKDLQTSLATFRNLTSHLLKINAQASVVTSVSTGVRTEKIGVLVSLGYLDILRRFFGGSAAFSLFGVKPTVVFGLANRILLSYWLELTTCCRSATGDWGSTVL